MHCHVSLGCAGPLSITAQDTQKPAEKPKPSGPIPSGPQTDGAFRKVILDSDRETDGEWRDTVIDPMEMAVAPDGRVLWAATRRRREDVEAGLKSTSNT